MDHCRFLWNFLGVSHESLREFRTNLKRVSHESLREFRTNLGFSCDDCISWLKKAGHCRGDAMWGLGGLPHFWGVAVVAFFRSHFHSKHVMVSCAREGLILRAGPKGTIGAASVAEEVAAPRPAAESTYLQRGHQRMREGPKAPTVPPLFQKLQLRGLLRTVITSNAAISA